MRRDALRPSFVVTFALGAAAFATGCGSTQSIGNPPPPSSDAAVSEAGAGVNDAAPDVGDSSPDGEGQDGSRD